MARSRTVERQPAQEGISRCRDLNGTRLDPPQMLQRKSTRGSPEVASARCALDAAHFRNRRRRLDAGCSKERIDRREGRMLGIARSIIRVRAYHRYNVTANGP